MHRYSTIGDLFDERPGRWGLRGDPWLWEKMRERLAATTLPSSASELERALEQAFEELTGHSIATDANFFVEAFSHGGISSGGISPSFWRGTALPLLRSRFAESLLGGQDAP